MKMLTNCTFIDKLDIEVLQDGVRVFIDKKAQLSLLGKHLLNTQIKLLLICVILIFTGTEMDFVENKLSSEFVFNNPNIKGTCGCGESFSL